MRLLFRKPARQSGPHLCNGPPPHSSCERLQTYDSILACLSAALSSRFILERCPTGRRSFLFFTISTLAPGIPQLDTSRDKPLKMNLAIAAREHPLIISSMAKRTKLRDRTLALVSGERPVLRACYLPLKHDCTRASYRTFLQLLVEQSRVAYEAKEWTGPWQQM